MYLRWLINVKYGIIMDEIDGLSNGDKGGFNSLISIINIKQKSVCPIICITNNFGNSKLNKLKGLSVYFKINKPSVKTY